MEQQLLEELETKRRLQEEEESRKMVSLFYFQQTNNFPRPAARHVSVGQTSGSIVCAWLAV